MQCVITRLVFVVVLALAPSPAVFGATPDSMTESAAFLDHAAADQQSEIDMGQLAIRKAADEQVKEFGARMVTDHQKAQQELRSLASKEGLQLHARPSKPQQERKAQLSQLSGKAFDQAYITTMLEEHARDLKELGKQSLIERNPEEVRQWAASALPVVKEHLARAKTIASSLGLHVSQAASPNHR
jgi:putative membrane protein